MKFITRSTFYKQHIEPALIKLAPMQYLLLRHKSPLTEWAWFDSLKKGRPVDKEGNAIPWFTYSFLDAFADRIPPDAHVFEFGAGMSTRWWAERVTSVTSVEHEPEWYNSIQSQLPDNARVMLRDLNVAAYAASIADSDNRYDIIIIDGRMRVACTQYALNSVSDRGVIIFDNSERPKYKPALDMLCQAGFKSLRFTGFIPQDFMGSETTVFYRNGNCLNI